MTIELTPGRALAAQPGSMSTWSAPAQAPAHPDYAAIVGLITELFAEGVLTGDQLAVIGGTNEMKQMLDETIAGSAGYREAAE